MNRVYKLVSIILLLLIGLISNASAYTTFNIYVSPQGITDPSLYEQMNQYVWGTVTVDTDAAAGTATILAAVDNSVYSKFYDVPLNIGFMDFNSTLNFGTSSISVVSGTPESIDSPGVDQWDYGVKMGRDNGVNYQQLDISINGLPNTITDQDFIVNNSLTQAAYGITSPFLVGLWPSQFGYNSLGAPATLYLYADPSLYKQSYPTGSSSVPEPSSFALLGIGLFGLGFASRKKKAK